MRPLPPGPDKSVPTLFRWAAVSFAVAAPLIAVVAIAGGDSELGTFAAILATMPLFAFIVTFGLAIIVWFFARVSPALRPVLSPILSPIGKTVDGAFDLLGTLTVGTFKVVLAVAIPLGLLYAVVRFIKWAWVS